MWQPEAEADTLGGVGSNGAGADKKVNMLLRLQVSYTVTPHRS